MMHSSKFFEFKILSFTFLTLFTVLAIRGDAADPNPLTAPDFEREKPGMLARVQRSPGFRPDDPSLVPNGDQAEIYYDLLETDPEKTNFRQTIHQETLDSDPRHGD